MPRLCPCVLLAVILLSGCGRQPQEAPVDAVHAYSTSVQATTVLKTGTTTANQPLRSSVGEPPEVTGLRVVIPPGARTGWHRHGCAGYAYVISGTLIVEVAGMGHKSFPAGTAFAEVVDLSHDGRNEGSQPVELIAFFTGQAGVPITVRTTPPQP